MPADLILDWDWESPHAARGEELRATWARLSIRAGDATVTHVEDIDARGVRDAIYLPLYPVAEWIVSNWWSLLNEVETPDRSRDRAYRRRHVMQAGAEGFALPALEFAVYSDLIALRWSACELPDSRLRFLSTGVAHCPRDNVEERLRGFVAAVVRRLEDEGVTKTLLQEDWSAIAELDDDEVEFCRAVGSLGADPFSVTGAQSARVTKALGPLAPNVREEFLACASLDLLARQSSSLRRFASTHRNKGIEIGGLARVASAASAGHAGAPWSEGYGLARVAREELGLNGEPIGSVDALGAALRVQPEEWARATSRRPSGLAFLDAAIVRDGGERAYFALAPRGEVGSTFLACRALGEHLTARSAELSIVSRSLSWRQQRNRAFAAEFLAPADQIRSRVSGAVVSHEEVDSLAEHFCVSSLLIGHQMENHRIARVAGWQSFGG